MNLRTTDPQPDAAPPQLLCAAWVAAPHPLTRDGAVLIGHGEIMDVFGHRREMIARYPNAQVIDLGNTLLLPGLINAHTHLELSDCSPGPPPTDGFAGWLGGMQMRTRLTPEKMEHAVQRAIVAGVEQCVRFGVTTIGDISRQCHLTRPLLRNSPLRVVSYGEVFAMAQRRGLLEERVAIATDATCATSRLRIGITPHAPYSVEPAAYRRCLDLAKSGNLPLATHVAETSDEALFLSDHQGPLRDLWDKWLTWDDSVPTFAGGPIRFARELGLLDYPTLLAHVNYCDDAELAILAEGKASVVYCPRTHQFFGHPPHRWREMLARKINVAVGTDSCASSPNLNLVDDLRLLHRLAPDLPAQNIWFMATASAARAVGLGDSVGRLWPGARADIVAFPVARDDPLTEILENDVLPSAVWIDGRQVA